MVTAVTAKPCPTDKARGGEVHSGSQGCAQANARQAVFLGLIRKQSDAHGFLRHGNNILIVHHEASCGVAIQVDVDQQVVEACPQQTFKTKRKTQIVQ